MPRVLLYFLTKDGNLGKRKRKNFQFICFPYPKYSILKKFQDSHLISSLQIENITELSVQNYQLTFYLHANTDMSIKNKYKSNLN